MNNSSIVSLLIGGEFALMMGASVPAYPQKAADRLNLAQVHSLL